MKHARLLIALLLLATVLVDLVAASVVVSYCRSPQGWPHGPLLIVFALATSQVSLVAIWAGFGRRSLPWRITALAAILVAWSRLIAIVQQAGPLAAVASITSAEIISDCTSMLLVQTVPVLACLAIARAVGVKLVAAGDVHSPSEERSGLSSRQFSIAYLLAWMVAVGVLLGLIKWSVDRLFLRELPPFIWREYALLGLRNAALALVALWTALGTRRLGLRVLVLCVTIAGAIFSWKLHVLHVRFPSVPVTLCLGQVVWLLGSLGVIRVAGYRLVRSRRAREQAAQTDVAPVS